jgi:plastocyanin
MAASLRFVLVLAFLGILSLPIGGAAVGVAAAPPDTATMVFGKVLGNRPPTTRPCVDVRPGRPDCFAGDHDGSGNAADDIVPRTAVIATGGQVSFIRADGRHQAAVYAPGTDVRALQAAAAASAPPGPPSEFNIDTATLDRVYLGPLQGAWPAGPAGAQTTPAGTFTEPGRYLVVCTFRPHFIDNNMYGWINVQ